jgi:hypothetical protein
MSNRSESATTSSWPSRASPIPTGNSPTLVLASSGCGEPSARLLAEKASSASLARAVTQTTRPLSEVITRTGLHPAGTRRMTECAGSVSARATLITLSEPTSLWPRELMTSLVEYSHLPSGETASPTGASWAGIAPT